MTLDFDSLPSEQGWTYGTFGISEPEENTVFSVSNNILTQNTLSLGNTGGIYYTLENVLDETQDFTLSWRSRVIEEESVVTNPNYFGFTVAVTSSSQRFIVGFSTEKIGISPFETVSGSFDNTVFHDYRIEGSFSSQNAQFFVDDVLTANLSPINGTSIPNGLFFGDGTSTMNAKAEITSYSFRQVPEPLTILGAGTAVSFGATFKRKLAKTKNQKKNPK